MRVEITFTEPVLATTPGNKEIATDYVLSKNPNGVADDEYDVLEETEKSSTVFPLEDDKPFKWDYQIKGFFKEACETMIMTDVMKQEELKKVRLTKYLFKKTIDKMIHIAPRKVFYQIPEGGKITINERPLRKENFKGGKVALARSEELPIGTKLVFEIIVRNPNLEQFIKPWLDEGKFSGFGQWRSASWGRFEWKDVSEGKA